MCLMLLPMLYGITIVAPLSILHRYLKNVYDGNFYHVLTPPLFYEVVRSENFHCPLKNSINQISYRLKRYFVERKVGLNHPSFLDTLMK